LSVDRINHSLSIQDGQLFVEDCNVASLARKYGTPLFVVSENHLRHNFRKYLETFSRCWPEGSVRVMPSIKASPLIAIRQILSTEGAGCDVFGPGELEAAIRGGVEPSLISVNGSIKDREIIRRAIDIGARIVLDSPRELELCEQEAVRLGKTATVMFRLKPYLADSDANSDYVPDHLIRDFTQIVKYGIPKSELLEMAQRYRDVSHVRAVGVHVHMGRHSKGLDVWESWVRNTIDLTAELVDAIGDWAPKVVNFGGGFPSFPDDDTDVTIKGYPGPTLQQMAETVTSTCRKAMQERRLDASDLIVEVEPGRGIHCDTGIHLTTVRNLKVEEQNLSHKWVEVDTSQMFLGVGGVNLERPQFDFHVANKASQTANFVGDIVGQTCNLEILFYQVKMPTPAIGDVIALLNTGSYIEPCAQNFNALPRPGTVLVSGSIAEMIKRHETVDEVFLRDVVPDRLIEAQIKEAASQS